MATESPYVHVPGSKHSRDLAKITTGLLIGMLALMTFLLSVGLQHPKLDIEIFMYASLGLLGLGLLAFEAASFLGSGVKRLAKMEVPKDKAEATELKIKQDKAAKSVRVAHGIQRIIFVLTVVAVVGFGMVATQLFFPAPTPTSTGTTAQ